MKRKALAPILLGMTAGLGAVPSMAAADVYRWVDAQGVVNYTQQKPDGVSAVRISSSGQVQASRSSTAAPSPATATAKPGANTQDGKLTAEQQRMLEELKAAEAERQLAYDSARADNCERATRVLKRLQSSGRIRVKAADGTQSVMPEDDRQRRIAEAQEGVAANCS